MMFRNYPNDRLLHELRSTYGDELSSLVKMVRLLEEVDRRRLYAELGYSSLFRFCLGVLNMSEHEAYFRIRVARAGRRFAVIFGMIERGEIHLSGVAKLSRHLTAENHRELLEAARGRTKRGIAELIAERFPQADVSTSIRRLPASAAPALTAPQNAQLPLAAPIVREQPVEAPNPSPPQPASMSSPHPVAAAPFAQPSPSPAPRPGVVQPLATDRYAVRFTASKRCRDLIDRARALMSHRAPDAELSDVVEVALEVLVEQLEKKKFKKTDRPRSQPDDSTGDGRRTIPAAVQREVAERDGERCTYVAPDGKRCDEVRLLEFDHVEPVARGGKHTVTNLRLRCRTHNAFTARQDFGDQHIDLCATGFRPSTRSTIGPALGP